MDGLDTGDIVPVVYLTAEQWDELMADLDAPVRPSALRNLMTAEYRIVGEDE